MGDRSMNRSEMLTLLAQTNGLDPELVAGASSADLVAHLLEQGANGSPSEPPIEADNNSRRKRSMAVRERIISMHAELKELRRRNAVLAAAVGACANCWGEDASCAVCEGDGGPGAVEPDGSLAMAFLEPAFARLQEKKPGRADASHDKEGMA